MADPAQNFLEFFFQNLLDAPEELKIGRKEDEYGILFEVQVAEADMGKLIGKGGQTVKAVRLLLRMLGARMNQHVNLKILEPLAV